MIKVTDDIRIRSVRGSAGDFSELRIDFSGEVTSVAAVREGVDWGGRRKMGTGKEDISYLDRTRTLLAIMLPFSGVSPYSAVPSVLDKVRKGSASPVEKNGLAETFEFLIFVPLKVRGVLPISPVEY